MSARNELLALLRAIGDGNVLIVLRTLLESNDARGMSQAELETETGLNRRTVRAALEAGLNSGALRTHSIKTRVRYLPGPSLPAVEWSTEYTEEQKIHQTADNNRSRKYTEEQKIHRSLPDSPPGMGQKVHRGAENTPIGDNKERAPARGLGTQEFNIEPKSKEGGTPPSPPARPVPLGQTPADDDRLLGVALEQLTLVDAADYKPARGGKPFRELVTSLRLKNATPDDLVSSKRRAKAKPERFGDFLEWWETQDWRGTGKNGKEPGRRPNPEEVPAEYRRFVEWREKGATSARASPAAVDEIENPILRGAARLAAKHVTRDPESNDEPRTRVN